RHGRIHRHAGRTYQRRRSRQIHQSALQPRQRRGRQAFSMQGTGQGCPSHSPTVILSSVIASPMCRGITIRAAATLFSSEGRNHTMSLFARMQSVVAAVVVGTCMAVGLLAPLPSAAQSASGPAATAASEAAAATPAPPPPVATTSKETIDNPYGLSALWAQGDFVAKGT